MSETETETVEETPTEGESDTETETPEVPEGVDPETGEVTSEAYFDSEDAGQQAAREREAELAAEKQQADQEQAASEAEIERQQKSLDRATKSYLDKLRATLGDDLSGFQPCPMCADGWPGIRLPVMPSQEAVATIKVAIGEDPDPPLVSDHYSRPCDGCEGHGRVGTGSHVTGHKSVLCLDCAGKGYISVGPEREAVQPPAPNGGPVVDVPQPLAGDPPRTPEEDTLRQLGAIVVWPPKPPDMTKIGAY
jgi:hypothetical protein